MAIMKQVLTVAVNGLSEQQYDKKENDQDPVQ